MIDNNKSINNKIPTLGIVSLILFIILLGGFIILRQINTKPAQKEVSTITKTPKPTTLVNAVFNIVPENDAYIYTIGEESTFIIKADSKAQIITGYDLVIQYPDDILKYEGFVSTDDRFDIYEITEEGKIILTGLKKQSEDKDFYINNTPLVMLTFRPIKNGSFDLLFNFTKDDTRDTNFVNKHSVDILTQAEGFTGYVGKTIDLSVGDKRTIPDTAFSVVLTQIDIPLKPCNDCAVKIIIDYESKKDKGQMTFSLGGFTGISSMPYETEDTMFEVVQKDENTITLKFAKIK